MFCDHRLIGILSWNQPCMVYFWLLKCFLYNNCIIVFPIYNLFPLSCRPCQGVNGCTSYSPYLTFLFFWIVKLHYPEMRGETPTTTHQPRRLITNSLPVPHSSNPLPCVREQASPCPVVAQRQPQSRAGCSANMSACLLQHILGLCCRLSVLDVPCFVGEVPALGIQLS